jgi:hypothetical protein
MSPGTIFFFSQEESAPSNNLNILLFRFRVREAPSDRGETRHGKENMDQPLAGKPEVAKIHSKTEKKRKALNFITHERSPKIWPRMANL